MDLLRWGLRHGTVTVDQIARRFFGSTKVAYRRVALLEGAGLLRRDWAWRGLPQVVRVTAPGARLADCDLFPARLHYAELRHGLAVVDLAEELLADHPGACWTTDRELRRDRARERRAGGAGAGLLTRPTPDGLLVLNGGRRVAVELDLTSKRSERLAGLLEGYGGDRSIDAVWWHCPSAAVCRRMAGLVRDLGMEHRVEVREWHQP